MFCFSPFAFVKIYTVSSFSAFPVAVLAVDSVSLPAELSVLSATYLTVDSAFLCSGLSSLSFTLLTEYALFSLTELLLTPKVVPVAASRL